MVPGWRVGGHTQTPAYPNPLPSLPSNGDNDVPFLRLPRTLQTISAACNILVAFAPTPPLFHATVASLQDKGREEVGVLAVWGFVRAHWTAGSAEWWARGIGRGIATVAEVAGCGWVFGDGEEWWGAEVPVLVGGDGSTDVAEVFGKWCFVERRKGGGGCRWVREWYRGEMGMVA
ncbi:hypothetical protein B9Z19DRAFT_458903 [Tuber borchii]|uniref:Uncharacterized protein n=1 Tax=Tuber borchii TaxID=42251 RepID=A0A2T6ZFT8_TUBBO|nr:hypothetical protein B9Z19DRAFT_458903 [Tuber borchii]